LPKPDVFRGVVQPLSWLQESQLLEELIKNFSTKPYNSFDKISKVTVKKNPQKITILN